MRTMSSSLELECFYNLSEWPQFFGGKFVFLPFCRKICVVTGVKSLDANISHVCVTRVRRVMTIKINDVLKKKKKNHNIGQNYI